MAASIRMIVLSLFEVHFFQATRRNIPEDTHLQRDDIWRRVAYNIKLLIMKFSRLLTATSALSALTHNYSKNSSHQYQIQ